MPGMKEENSRAVCVRTIEADWRNFNEFKEVHEINPQEYPMVFPQINDDTEYALKLLDHYGYQSKVFCLGKENDHNCAFEVKSNQWDWNVTPLKIKKVNQIPKILKIGLCILIENNVRIDGIAVAIPKPQEDASEVVNQEFYNGFLSLFKIFQFVFQVVSITLISSMKSISEVSHNDAPVNLVEVPDPVLLVKIQDKWIEIGRWS